MNDEYDEKRVAYSSWKKEKDFCISKIVKKKYKKLKTSPGLESN